WAVEQGLISGVGNNLLDPQGQATRAQVATILARFIDNA
ncbi:MAG TPA: S-layer homology domain-containing protein, partial [Candidatus Agathobaculum pullicola]|nr:S-layer homology domain-containing protein [Candidatus Agathobaculum pullicola]HIX90927.1 S-layer homology domain-containing protein [Candidatus Agathobaculum pullicola]